MIILPHLFGTKNCFIFTFYMFFLFNFLLHSPFLSANTSFYGFHFRMHSPFLSANTIFYCFHFRMYTPFLSANTIFYCFHFRIHSSFLSANTIFYSFHFRMHSPSARCPHPRVLPNLMAVFLAAIWSAFDTKCSYRFVINTQRILHYGKII